MIRLLFPSFRLLLLGAGLFSCQLLPAEVVSPQVGVVPVIEQLLTIEGQRTEVEIAPVLGDKEWALTARWDDNNQNSLNMQKTMAAAGMKGTFYLNESAGNAGREFARQLGEDGSSVGGHTEHHNFLTHLSANRIFREIYLNRITREADTDRSINSFAFPFGRYKEERAPLAFERITNAWLRSGYHHNVYEKFILENPYMPANFASTGNQIYAGDRKIEPEKFHAQMNRILNAPDQYKPKAPAISMGVHTWQPAAELVKFEALLTEYTSRKDFWVCNQTELASYRFQAVQTQIVQSTDDSSEYHVTRPTAAFAGDAIPLTLRLAGPQPDRVLLDGAPLEVKATADPMLWLVNLPYPVGQRGPSLIDWTSNGPGVDDVRRADKFPGLDFSLNLSDEDGWEVILSNQGVDVLTDLLVTVRLPLIYENGVSNRFVDALAAQDSLRLTFPADQISADQALADGSLFAGAQIDFSYQGQQGRIYAVYEGETDTTPVPCIRDTSVVAGPFAVDEIQANDLLEFSQVGVELAPVNESPLGQWRTADSESSRDFARERFITFSDAADWRHAAAKHKRQPAHILVAVEFSLAEEAPLTIESERAIVFVLLDGVLMPLVNQSTATLSAGPHRMILCVDSEKRMSFSGEEPQHLSLVVNGKPLSALTSPKN